MTKTEYEVTELYAAYRAAESTADNGGGTPGYCRYLQAFMEMCATPSTTVADVLAKQEAFLKMELEGQQSKSFDEALAKPLSEHDMTMSAAISVYRDLKRLTNL